MPCISVPAAIGGLASAGAGIASAVGGSPSAPSYGETTAQTLQDQVNEAPAVYAANANPNYGQPAYAGLQLQDLNTELFGSPATTGTSTTNQTASQSGWYNAAGDLISPGTLDPNGPAQGPALFGGGNMHGTPNANGTPTYVPGNSPAPGATWRNKGSTFTVNGTTATAAQPGVIAQGAAANTATRTANINDLATLGPQATQAMLASDPADAALLGKLNTQANDELDAGSSLTPEQQRTMQQEARAAFAARGMGGGTQAVTDELMNQFNLGQQLLQQRQAFAQSLIGSNQSVQGNPASLVLGANSNAVGQAQSSQAQSGPSLFNPQAGLGLATSNYATSLQQAAANNPLNGLSNGITGATKALSSLGTALTGGGGASFDPAAADSAAGVGTVGDF